MDKLPCIYFSNNSMQGIIMHGNGKSWNDKMKLAMCELERKIQGEASHHNRREGGKQGVCGIKTDHSMA